MTIKEWQTIIHENARAHGWHESPRPLPEALCLIHAEVSEALEAYRNHNHDHIAEELADVVIRVLDTAEALGLDLEAEIARKHAYNVTRPYRHGNKRC